MATLFDKMPTRQALCRIASDFHQRGWMAGTAGNLSARSNSQPDCFWITASGLPKGQLEPSDFLQINATTGDITHHFHNQNKPSAETSIHQTIYQLYPDAGACFHVHSVEACICTSKVSAEQTVIPLPAIEMLKGLDIWDAKPNVGLPLFENLQHVPAIAEQIKQRFHDTPPDVPALMIHNHGVTVWGTSLQQTYNRLEIVEFLMSYLAQQH